MIRARFSPRATGDLDEHCDYIAADNPEAASRVRMTILGTADFLAQRPRDRQTYPSGGKPACTNPLVCSAEVPQLFNFLPTLWRYYPGCPCPPRGTGLDAVFWRAAECRLD